MRTVSDIIDALGGSAAVSRGTGIPLTTIESWKTVNFVPEWRRQPILALALAKNEALATDDFPPASERRAKQATA